MPKTEPQTTDATTASDVPKTTPNQRASGSRVGELFKSVPGPLIGLVVIFIAMSFLSPFFLSFRNLINIISQVSDIGVMAVGAAMVIIIGGIDLSVGSTLALSMMTMAWVYKIQGIPFPVAIIVGLLIGALVGLVNGLLSTYARIQPFVATLATMSACAGLALFITNGNPVTQFPDWFGDLTGTFLGLPVEGIILVAIYLIAAFWLRFRPSGRALYAIGGNEEVARLSGINVRALKVRVYITAGVLAAVAGLLVVSRLDSAAPTAGAADLLNVIAVVVIGGASLAGGSGTMFGTFVGLLIIGTLEQRHVAAQRVAEPAAGGHRHRDHRRGAARPRRVEGPVGLAAPSRTCGSRRRRRRHQPTGGGGVGHDRVGPAPEQHRPHCGVLAGSTRHHPAPLRRAQLFRRDPGDEVVEGRRDRRALGVEEAQAQLPHGTRGHDLPQVVLGEEVVARLQGRDDLAGADPHEREVERVEQAEGLPRVGVVGEQRLAHLRGGDDAGCPQEDRLCAGEGGETLRGAGRLVLLVRRPEIAQHLHHRGGAGAHRSQRVDHVAERAAPRGEPDHRHVHRHRGEDRGRGRAELDGELGLVVRDGLDDVDFAPARNGLRAPPRSRR